MRAFYDTDFTKFAKRYNDRNFHVLQVRIGSLKFRITCISFYFKSKHGSRRITCYIIMHRMLAHFALLFAFACLAESYVDIPQRLKGIYLQLWALYEDHHVFFWLRCRWENEPVCSMQSSIQSNRRILCGCQRRLTTTFWQNLQLQL